jgi:hypothetical protein
MAVLKGKKRRPRFKASGMEEKADQDEKECEAGAKRRAGLEKRSKTALLTLNILSWEVTPHLLAGLDNVRLGEVYF